VPSPTDDLLAGQLAYYRARAAEYDETSYGAVTGERDAIPGLVDAMRIDGDVLEIAGGTGMWTRELARVARSVTYLDGAPEMAALARERVTAPNVSFEVADVFDYEPQRQFDVVFFAAWISHVPLSRFDAFWSVVGAALAPGGRALFLDELPARAHHEPAPFDSGDGSLARRKLIDGSEHVLVKVFWEPKDLEAKLAAIGWSSTVTPVVNDWYVGEARRA
jgi:demethylmenaquinone methyltransferase/2-methoxy-6-polyprenyl-1,4-benzoquinol methylase